MKRLDVALLLPPARNDYSGPRVAVWFLVLANVVGTARSLIHILTADSGAQSIAHMSVHVAGGQNIIALLAQWGGAQLLMALVIWVVLWRYRVLVPLMIGEVALEQLVRIVIGQYKPLLTTGTPPGSYGSWILLPLAVLMLAVALLRDKPKPVTGGAA